MNIHSRRKMAQMEAGAQMRQLEADWVAMITNNYKSVSYDNYQG